ncbi:MAG: hypothetical protein U0J08_08100 [Agathobaculum butyriciproducens]|nr:hypothetical protein [Agathobaculum butyriciproducens]
MTDAQVLQALKRLRVETGSLACFGCGHEHSCNVHGCQILREGGARLEHFIAENRALRSALASRPAKRAQKQARDASVTFLREMAKESNAQRAKAEAERDALLEQIKARRSCLDCKHFDYCEFDDATVIECMNCVTKNCPCYQCGNSSRWEWRGLPEAPEVK